MNPAGFVIDLRENFERYRDILAGLNCDDSRDFIGLLDKMLLDMKVEQIDESLLVEDADEDVYYDQIGGGSQTGGGRETIMVVIIFIYLCSVITVSAITSLDGTSRPETRRFSRRAVMHSIRRTSRISDSNTNDIFDSESLVIPESANEINALKTTVKEYAVKASEILPSLMETKHIKHVQRIFSILELIHTNPHTIVPNLNTCLDLLLDLYKPVNNGNIIILLRNLKVERDYVINLFQFAKDIRASGLKAQVMNVGFFFWSLSFMSTSLTIINKYFISDQVLLENIKKVIHSFHTVSNNHSAVSFLQKYFQFIMKLVNIVKEVSSFVKNGTLMGGTRRNRRNRRNRKSKNRPKKR
jgi:hypothetical protein